MDKKCTEKGCERKHLARGMCQVHYVRKYYLENREACTGYSRKYYASRRTNPEVFLRRCYIAAQKRVRGKGSKHNKVYYKHLPILPREEFLAWALKDPTFLKLYRYWQVTGFQQKYVPTMDRLDSDNGYVLENIEWVTLSENCTRAQNNRWGLAA